MTQDRISRPEDEAAAIAVVRNALAAQSPIRLAGGGTRTGFGRPVQAGITLSSARLTGITLYEPSEMVIGARAGTPLAEIEATLSAKGQMLPFEPSDFRRLYGSTGTPTIGAVAAGNLSGPRRIWAGACRDSLIGVRFVNGDGDIIKSGGRVMKNVTGLDLVKLQAGAWGTLGFLTEVIFKVVPKPEVTATLVLSGLDDAAAIRAMSTALGSPFEITGAAHEPQAGRTALRIEGVAASVDYRAGELARRLAAFGALTRLDDKAGASFWTDLRDAVPLAEPRDAAVWRVSVKPSAAAGMVAAIRAAGAVRALYDWGGGLVWLACEATGDAGAAAIRKAARAAKGYATLMRAPEAIRASIAVFEPEPPAIAALTGKIKTAVDPAHLFNPGLMQAGV
jgi:glycolate oxidase FAD binding subunit